jgi:Frog skin active peptide family signal and propeptide
MVQATYPKYVPLTICSEERRRKKEEGRGKREEEEEQQLSTLNRKVRR